MLKYNYSNNKPSQSGVSSDSQTLLSYSRLPARLNPKQTAQFLGFSEHDIPILVSVKLLPVLGNPVQNATKYFPTCEIKDLAINTGWLDKATQAVYDYWIKKNARKTKNNLSPFSEKAQFDMTGDCRSGLN
jgi:hypothetical protein